MGRRVVACALLVLACGRTALDDDPGQLELAGDAGTIVDAGVGQTDGGTDAGRDLPLIVALVGGVAIAHSLDGLIRWRVDLGGQPLPDAGLRLASGAGLLGWIAATADGGRSVGVTASNGQSRHLADGAFNAGALWAGPGGISASNGTTGVALHLDALAQTTRGPVGPPSVDGFLPCARSSQLFWVKLDGGAERRVQFNFTPALIGDWALYFADRNMVVQSMPSFDQWADARLSTARVRRVALDRVVVSDTRNEASSFDWSTSVVA